MGVYFCIPATILEFSCGMWLYSVEATLCPSTGEATGGAGQGCLRCSGNTLWGLRLLLCEFSGCGNKPWPALGALTVLLCSRGYFPRLKSFDPKSSVFPVLSSSRAPHALHPPRPCTVRRVSNSVDRRPPPSCSPAWELWRRWAGAITGATSSPPLSGITALGYLMCKCHQLLCHMFCLILDYLR